MSSNKKAIEQTKKELSEVTKQLDKAVKNKSCGAGYLEILSDKEEDLKSKLAALRAEK